MTRRRLAALLSGAAVAGRRGRAQSALGSMMWDYIKEYLRLLDERRAQALAALQSEDDFAQLRSRVRERLAEMWGAFPERTPLNPRQTGLIERGDYVVEKIVFESRPGFYITANLYRPKTSPGKLPAIVFPGGHADGGKAGETHQRFAILMARQGFAVLAWDPLGQGERLQLWDAQKQASAVGTGTAEHRALGNPCYLLGMNLMQYRAWDATRALDYLESRPEVDAARIGIAGQSGGGMTALQFACFDDRLKAAFASCAVATFRHKTEALLIADPEQILYGTLRYGIDHPELLAAFAPKPLLIGAAIRDYVPIAGARRTHAELALVYEKLGAPENLALAETDAGHGLNRELREAAAAFFLRALAGRRETVAEEPAEPAPPEELFATANGQVATAFADNKTVQDFNVERAAAAAPQFTMPANASEFDVYRHEIAHRIRNVTRVGAFKAEHGIEITDRILDAGPFAKGTAFVVADRGKDDDAVRRNAIDAVVAADYQAIGLDLRGWGDSAAFISSILPKFDWDDFFAYRSLELGRPLFGQRLKDLLAAAPTRTSRRGWYVVGVGIGGLIAAHAAALDPRILGAASIGAPLSYRSLVEDALAEQPVSAYLPGVIEAYEIRDAYAAAAPRPLLIVNPQDARRRPADAAAAGEEFDWTRRIYELLEAPAALTVASGLSRRETRETLRQWFAALED